MGYMATTLDGGGDDDDGGQCDGRGRRSSCAKDGKEIKCGNRALGELFWRSRLIFSQS